MSDVHLVDWCGATWSVGEQHDGSYRCTVVHTTSTSGWHVGDHCWLEAKEIHPSRTNTQEEK